MIKFSIFVSLLMECGLCTSREVDEPAPRVVTPLGSIEGYWRTSYGGRRYKAFEGIPFAQPPTGEFRFRVARRVLPWNETLIANKFGSTCLQYYPNFGQKPPGSAIGSEDCLFLNVYTAIRNNNKTCRKGDKKARNKLLPVIVFIHGGAFQFGAGSQYGPKYLLDHDVIFVTFNYRVGPLGFLSTEDDIVPGNMGLKDQVLAMRWVKENIYHFGGNPSSITLTGLSAGSASVHYHFLSNLSKGLFHRAISVSGNALNCWAQTENSLEKAKKLATILGCPSDDVQLMVDCLRIRPADQITNATGEFMSFLYNPFTPFGPVVENRGSECAFIDRSPIDILTSGPTPSDVPWITSAVSQEGLFTTAEFLSREALFEELNNNWESIAPNLLDFNFTIPQCDHARIARFIRQHYLGSCPMDRTTINETVQMCGNRWFVYETQKAVTLQAQANRSPVRFYSFSYKGAHSFSEILSGTNENFGVSRVDDLVYTVDAFMDPTTTPRDRQMQKFLVKLWVTFATDGVPDVGIEWTEVSRCSKDDLRYLHIAGPDQIVMENSSNFGDKNFWDTIRFNENIKHQNRCHVTL